MKTKKKLLLFSTVINLALGIYGAFMSLHHVPTVTIITVFAGAFGAGASVVGILVAIKADKQGRKEMNKTALS